MDSGVHYGKRKRGKLIAYKKNKNGRWQNKERQITNLVNCKHSHMHAYTQTHSSTQLRKERKAMDRNDQTEIFFQFSKVYFNFAQ